MAQQTLNPYDRPGEKYDGENQAAGDPSDPRSGYDPQSTPMGNPADPRGDYDPLRGRKKDKKKDKKDHRDKEDSEAKRGLRDAEDQAGDKSGLYNPNDAAEASPEDLEDEEKGSGLYRAGKKKAKSKARGYFRRNKKKIGIGGGIGLSLIGGGIGILTLLLPLKVEHIVSNLQNRFFGSAQNAIREEAGNMFKEYLISRVLPGYESCGQVVKAGCTARKFGQGPVANLYRSWADARIETKLADNGIRFERHTLSQTWRVYAPGLPENGENIGRDGKGLYRVYDDYPAFRDDTKSFVKNETKWSQVLFRFQVNRNLVGKKFNSGRFCLVFCGITDPLNKKYQEQKLASKIFLTQRVILPRNETLAIALLCLMNNCNPNDNQPSGDDGVNGSPESEYDKDTRLALEAYAAKFLDRPLRSGELDELLGKYKEIAETGFQQYVVTKGLTPVLSALLGESAGTAAATTTSKLIPVVGWIHFAAQIVHAGDHSSETLKKLRYTVNGAAAVSLYLTYRTQADEIHTGGDNAIVSGSFAESLSSGNHGEPTDPIVGGTAGAEQSPLYSVVIEGKSSKAVTAAPQTSDLSVASLLEGRAFAASGGQTAGTAYSNYRCNNGLPLPFGQLICPEEFLGGGNSIANGVHDFLNMPGVSILTVIADGWMASIGGVIDFAGGILGTAFSTATAPLNAACDAPIIGTIVGGGGYCVIRDLAQEAVPIIVEGVTKWMIPNPFSTNMSGARIFNMMAAGADVLGNEFSHLVLGGMKLTDLQNAQIVREEMDYQRREFEQQPVFARMFDTESQHSLVTKVAMEMPLGGPQASARAGMATLLNPLGALGQGFSSIFSGRASADVDAEPDPFGVPQYGYPKGTIPDNPEQYWKNHCSDNAAFAYQKDNRWNEAASGTDNADPETGTPMNKTTNACLLIKATVGAAGGLYDMNNLTDDDLGTVTADGESVGGVASVSDDARELAQQILDNDKISKIGRYVMEDLKHTANGQPAYGDVTLDVKLLQFLAELGTTTPYTITSISGAGCGHSNDTCVTAGGSSNHYIGKGVDFGCGFDEGKADEVAKKYGYMAQNERCDGGVDHSHFSPDGY